MVASRALHRDVRHGLVPRAALSPFARQHRSWFPLGTRRREGPRHSVRAACRRKCSTARICSWFNASITSPFRSSARSASPSSSTSAMKIPRRDFRCSCSAGRETRAPHPHLGSPRPPADIPTIVSRRARCIVGLPGATGPGYNTTPCTLPYCGTVGLSRNAPSTEQYARRPLPFLTRRLCSHLLVETDSGCRVIATNG